MLSRIITIFILLLSALTAAAQEISLEKKEVKKLISLIKTNESAKKVYHSLEIHANTALNQSPNPVDTIISEGHLATDPKKIHTQKALADLSKIYALAYTYRITNKHIYLNKCIEFISAWAKVNQAVANPINNTKLEPLFEAYDLIKDDIPSEDRKITNAWLTRIAVAEINNPKMNTEKSYNNWNSHRIKIVGDIAYILNDSKLKVYVDTMMKRQINKNLYANGSGMDFVERDALHYHAYTLEPLLSIATVIKRGGGMNFYTYVSPSGSSIAKSVDFFVPYATGKQTHPEFVNSTVAFDKARAANHEPGYIIGENFKPEATIEVFSYACYFNPAYTTIVKNLMNTSEAYPTWRCLLNKVRTD
jgi:hypothetical protein